MEIRRATIVKIDPDRGTLSAQIDSTHKLISDIPINPLIITATSVVIFVPIIGTKVYICFPDDEAFPFICGYMPAISNTDGHYRMSTPILDQGDFYIQTEAGQFFIGREGAIEIKTGSMAQILLTPYESRTALFGKNIEIHSPPGHMQLLTRTDKEKNGKTPTLAHLEFRQNAEDDTIVEIEFGNTEDFGDNIFFGMKINNNITITIDKDGKANIDSKDEITIHSQKNINIESDKDIVMKAENFDATDVNTLKLGGDSDNVAYFSKLKDILDLILDGFINNSTNIGANSGGPVPLIGPLANLLQAKAKLKSMLPKDFKAKL